MSQEKLYRILAALFKEDMNNINDASSPTSIKNWDSFNGLLLVDKLELEFKIKFTIDEVMDVKNVADIKRHLKHHGIKFP